MAITFDAVTNSGVLTNQTSRTISHTTGSLTNGIIVVATSCRDTSNTDMVVSGITYNGNALTKIRSEVYVVSGRVRVELWYGLNPAAGAHDAVISFTGTADHVTASVMTFSGVDQTNPILYHAAYSGNSAAPSLNMGISSTDAMLIDVVYSKINTTITAGGSQTERMNAAPNGGGDKAGVSTKPITSPALTTMSWSWTGSDDWAYAAVALQGSGVAVSPIAVSGAVASSRTAASSLTYAHTVAASLTNSIMVVGVAAQDSNHANLPVTGITYNGDALTKVRHDEATGNNRTELWYLKNPDSGTNNVVITLTGSVGEIAGASLVFTGVDQTDPEDAANGTTGSASSISSSVTTIADKALVVYMASAEAYIRSTNVMRLVQLADQSYENNDFGISMYKSGAGAVSVTHLLDASVSFATSLVSLTPAASATATNSERSAKTTGKDTSNSSRSAKLTGVATTNDSRNAKVTGKDSTNDSRAAKLTGQSTSNDTRSAKLTGVATTNDTRAAKLTGVTGANDSRSAKLTGVDTTTSERNAKVTGKLSANDIRSAKLTGVDTTNDTRSAKLQGKDTANDSRNAKLTGEISTSGTRSAKLTGTASTSDTRSAKVTGQLSASAERGAKTTGIATTNDSRNAKLTGDVDTNSERNAKLTGVFSANDSRNAKLTGGLGVTSERGAKVTGKLSSSSERSAELVGTGVIFTQNPQDWYDPNPQPFQSSNVPDWKWHW